MTLDERVDHLLRAAERAEEEGNLRVARTLRRMAGETRPLPASTLAEDSRPA